MSGIELLYKLYYMNVLETHTAWYRSIKCNVFNVINILIFVLQLNWFCYLEEHKDYISLNTGFEL